MDSMIAKLRVALQLDSAAFESGTNRAAQEVNALGINMQAARSRMNAFSEGLIVSGGNAQRLGSQMRAVNDNAGLMRAGLQNAGFQLQDMAVQFASGQRAGTILAQQLPQLSGAIAQIAQASGQTSGVIGRLASFLGGPWGVAVGVGTAVLSPFIAKLFETGKAADQAAIKVASFGDILAKARAKPAEALGDQQIKVLKAQGELAKAQAMARYTGGGSAAYAANTYQEKARTAAINRALYGDGTKDNPGLIALRSELETLQATVKNNESLFQIVNSAGRLSAKSLGADKSGGGSSARRAGQEAGREYRSGLEDELRKLEQTTGGLEATVFKPLADRTKEQFSFRDTNAAKYLREQLSDVSKVAGYTGEKIADTNRRIGDSFFDMSQRAIGSLQNLTNGIRSGDFLGTLSGILSVLESLGGLGLFGSKIQTRIAGARADGGPVSAGRMYLVGERGPELFLSRSGGTIVPNHALRGADGGDRLYFDLRGAVMTEDLLKQMNAIGAVSAQAGGEIGFNKVQRFGSRSLAR